MSHKHSVYDTDIHFSIDPVTRAIKNETGKAAFIQYDHNFERITFELPRTIEGHDMSQCNAVQVHYLNIEAATKQKHPGIYEVDDLQVSPDGDDVVTCSWLISQNATQCAGSLSFLVRFACIADDGTIDYAWNTGIYSGISIAEGIYNAESVAEEYADILEQWKAEIEADYKLYVDTAIANIPGGGGGAADGAVLYTPQELTEEQQAQARANIGTAKFEKDLGAFTPPNVLAGMSISYTEGAAWGSSGSIVSNQYTKNYGAISELVDVIAGQTYRIPKFRGNISLYDANGKNQQQIAHTTYPLVDFVFVVPDGKAKVGINFMIDTIGAPTVMYRETMTDEEFAALPLKNDDVSITHENIKSDAAVSLLAPLKGKTIVNFGDSIFGIARPPEDISTRLAELTGAAVHNCGFGGCRMAAHADANYDAFSMYRLANAVATGDFSLQEFALTNTAAATVPSYFAETVALLKNIDFSKVDIITIAYGTNDWNGGYTPGGGYVIDPPSQGLFDVYYLGGALRHSIETILTAHPHIRIVICCPTYRWFLDESNNFLEDSDTKVVTTHTLADCINQEREIAEEYKLPFIDNYNIGINKINRLYYFPANDGAHHNINGRRLIAEHIAKHLY